VSWADRVQSRWDSRGRGRSSEVLPGEPVVVDAEVFIARAAQAIWDAMADPMAVVRPGEPLRRIEPVEGTGPGVGRQLTLLFEQGGHSTLHVRTTTAEFPPTYGEWVVETGPGQTYRVQRWIEHTGSGCRVRWRSHYPCPATVSEQDRARYAADLHGTASDLGERWKRLLEA
jgi:hypothetical protein